MSVIDVVDRYISRIDRELEKERSCKSSTDLVRDVVGLFSADVPNIKHGLDRYRQRLWAPGMPVEAIDDLHDLRLLREKLLMYRDRIAEGDPSPSSGQTPPAPISVNVNSSPTQTVSVNSSALSTSAVAVTVSQICDAVDADPGLSEEQKAELQELLVQAKGAAAKGDSSLFARIGSKVMEGVEKATPSLVVKVLEFLLGLATGGL